MKPFGWDFPYASRRMPVLAANVVATSQPLAAQAGLRMLWDGGNAVDAAVAAAITLTVVEPTSNGMGSDLFCILWDGEKLHGLNASGRSPAAWTPEHFRGRSAMPRYGWDTVTVPGAVSGWVELWRRFGKLGFEKLFEPAVAYATDGFPVSPITARAWSGAAEAYRGTEVYGQWAAAFLPGGSAPQAGEPFRLPEQAATLKAIAETEGEAFYRGEIAEKILEHVRSGGGLMEAGDLDGHRCDWVGTVHGGWKDCTVHEIPPNGQGIAALIAQGIILNTRWEEFQPDSADGIHVQIEAMKLAFADAHRYVADAEHMEISPSEMLDAGYLAERASLIDMKRAGEPVYGTPREHGTVYLAAADESGMMVSLIQSNYMGFGSGIVVPGTGVSMQNRGAGFVLEEGHANRVGGGKRPYHTIIPGFVTREGKPAMSFGVMGGPMQPQGHLQMILRVLGHGQNPQAAADAPRWQVTGGKEVAVEEGFPPEVLEDLAGRGHGIGVRPQGIFGGAQLICRMDGGYAAASDKRKDGCAAGY
ncbi:MAG: gamma-glutamyltransferase family protein [Planctomycetes bacterium]|nr:gamma-glutamyltransferase family protein [Planctomycetota bacterium]